MSIIQRPSATQSAFSIAPDMTYDLLGKSLIAHPDKCPPHINVLVLTVVSNKLEASSLGIEFA